MTFITSKAYTTIYNKMSRKDKYFHKRIGKDRFNRLLVAALKHNIDEAAELFLWAATQQSSARIVSTFSYNLMLRHCFNSERMLQLLEIMKGNDVEMDGITINTVLTRLVVEGDKLRAKDLLAEYAGSNPDIVDKAAKMYADHGSKMVRFDRASDEYIEDARYEDKDQSRPVQNK